MFLPFTLSILVSVTLMSDFLLHRKCYTLFHHQVIDLGRAHERENPTYYFRHQFVHSLIFHSVSVPHIFLSYANFVLKSVVTMSVMSSGSTI
ncbi:hypothetical protein EDD22DRAFT_863708 [Suillus occidentalis]|nr:hypothetical protein EDD22DRAFT_863708 [Suillus occidentalis]